MYSMSFPLLSQLANAGGTITLKIRSEYSIENAKQKILDQIGILPDKLSFIFDGKQLEDSLTYCNFRKEEPLNFVLHLGSCMHIFVKTSKGITTLEVHPSDSIAKVKQKLKDLIPLHQQRLVYNDKRLHDSHTLGDYNIQNGSTLQLNRSLAAYIQIFVLLHNCKRYPVTVLQDDTVENLKQIISEKIGIPLDEQRLIFGGKFLEEGCILSDYNIQEYSTVFWVLRLHDLVPIDIYVKMSTGNTITMCVEPDESIAHVKQRIQAMEKVPSDQQLLTYSGVELEDGRCLRERGIGNGSTIKLVCLNKPFEISFTIDAFQITRVLQGAKLAVDVQIPILRSDTVKCSSFSESQQSSCKCLLLKQGGREICIVAFLKH